MKRKRIALLAMCLLFLGGTTPQIKPQPVPVTPEVKMNSSLDRLAEQVEAMRNGQEQSQKNKP